MSSDVSLSQALQTALELRSIAMEPPAHIENLPAELLISIFQMVWLEYRVGDGAKWGAANMLDSSLFPFSIASVSRRWRTLASSTSHYWTRVVVFVDSNPTPPALVESYLQWSCDLPVEVFITRRETDRNSGDPNEKARVRVVLDHVLPHLHRLRGLRINVMRRSSLPSLILDFHGSAPLLKRLMLNCQIDDGVPTGAELATNWTFEAPLLKEITLDGRNFSDVAVKRSGWLPKDLKYLALSQYKSHCVTDDLSLCDVVRVIAGLDKLFILTLRDLDIKTSLDGIPTHTFFRSPYVYLAGLGEELMTELISLAPFQPEWIDIQRCGVGSFEAQYFPFCSLYMRDMDPSCHLFNLVAGMNGFDFSFTNCPGVNDELLQALSSPDDNNEWPARRMSSLWIINCHVTPDALKDFVLARHTASRLEIPWTTWNSWLEFEVEFEVVNPICSVFVTGGGLLPEDYRTWFEQNLKEFSWQEEVCLVGSDMDEEDQFERRHDCNDFCPVARDL
ncbi:hypothetical protein HYDPIDRAFT_104394 [Hydnomerulius pinastri MD-312]|nr:hypothetical protein HYDPIDRAFT_104394 [Hydnomerulius pinastri MD-312]